jgi:hypothetical protein
MDNDLNFSLQASELKNVRNGLLRLHKALLEHEKENYEAAHGKIKTTGEYFNLVVNDAWFEWLRKMSGLIVEIDEAFDAKQEPLTIETVILLAGQVHRMLFMDEESDFGKRYQAALQNSPDAIFEHIGISKNLKKFNNEI